MHDYIKPLWKCSIDDIILLIKTNNALNEPFWVVIGKFRELKQFIKTTLSESNTVISDLLRGTGNDKPSLIVAKTNPHLYGL